MIGLETKKLRIKSGEFFTRYGALEFTGIDFNGRWACQLEPRSMIFVDPTDVEEIA